MEGSGYGRKISTLCHRHQTPPSHCQVYRHKQYHLRTRVKLLHPRLAMWFKEKNKELISRKGKLRSHPFAQIPGKGISNVRSSKHTLSSPLLAQPHGQGVRPIPNTHADTNLSQWQQKCFWTPKVKKAHTHIQVNQ